MKPIAARRLLQTLDKRADSAERARLMHSGKFNGVNLTWCILVEHKPKGKR